MLKFNTLKCALSFSNRAVKMHSVMLGDDGLYWVVPLAKMETLLASGYELAD